MIDLLKTVLGAVATKDIVPVLTHFCFYKSLFDSKGRIQGGNGILCIDAPFEHDIIECAVSATKFIKSIESCHEHPEFGVTPTGRLSIKHGRFKAYLGILPHSDYPVASQEGTIVKLRPNFVEALTSLKPFISEDASRPWSMSVLFSGGYIYATNNVIIVRTPYELDYEYDIAIPADAVNRAIDIAEMPSSCYMAESSFTLEYKQMWMRCQLLSGRWPAVSSFFDGFKVDVPVPADLADAVEKVRTFADEKFPVIKIGEEITTDSGNNGASVDGFDLPTASFHGDQIVRVLSVATHIDFSTYPKPCLFKGKNIEGLIVGIQG